MASERDRKLEHAVLEARAADECVVVWRQRGEQPAEAVVYATVPPWPSSEPDDRTASPKGSQSGSMVRVGLSRMPLTADGRVDLESLATLPVVDDELIGRWQRLVSGSPGVRQALVLACPSAESVPLVHVADILPPWEAAARHLSSQGREGDFHSAGAPSENTPSRPAHVCGGALRFAAELPLTLPEGLCRAAKLGQGDHLIYVGRDGAELRQSYGSLLSEAQRVLGGLRAAGLKAGDKAILQLQQNGDILPAFWGCVLGGIVPVLAPVPPTFEQPNRVLDQLRHLGSVLQQPVILTSEVLRPSLAAAVGSQWAEATKILSIEELRRHEPDREHWPCVPEDPALVSLTSGSTGLPKCVVLTHRNLIARAAGANELGRHGADDVVLNWLPFDHIASISDWHVRCVLLGCRMVYAPKEYVISQPLVWLELIERYRVSHTWAPNFAYALVSELVAKADSRSWDLSSVAAFLTAGEAVSAGTTAKFAEQLAACGLKPTVLRPAFGMAEMASGVTYYLGTEDAPLRICRVRRSSLSGRISVAAPNEADAVALVSLGPPIPGVSLRIVDAEGNIVGEETVGHLQVQGAPVSSGYYRAAEANSVFHDDGWFETGDLGFLRNGELYLTGRAKDCIIVNGANYGCGEIEEVVDAVPGVEASFSAACAVRDRKSGEEQWAVFFHTAQTTDRELAALLKEIRGRLARQMGIRPDYLIPVAKESIPKTAIGKLQRSELGRRFEAGAVDAILKRLDLLEANERTLPDAFFVPTWRRKELVNPEATQTGEVTLVFLEESDADEAVPRAMAAQGRAVITVRPGPEFEQTDANAYRLVPGRPEDYRRLVNSLLANQQDPDRIVWMEGFERAARGLRALVEAMLEGDSPVFAARRSGQSPRRLLVVGPENVETLGWLRAATDAAPWLRGRHVDTSAVEPDARAARVLAELDDLSADLEVQYRGNSRYVRGLEQVRIAEAPLQEFPVPSGSMCVVGGEPTDVAAELVRALVQRDVNVLLAVRPEGGDAAEEVWRAVLADCPDAAMVHRVDVCDGAALEEAIRQAEQRWGRSWESSLYIDESLPKRGTSAPNASPSPRKEVAALARALDKRGRGALLAILPADTATYEPNDRPGRYLCYGIATDPAHGALGLTPAQLRDSILAGWCRGLERLVLGLDGSHPAVRKMCDEGTCAAEHLVAYVEAPPEWSAGDLPSTTLPDRFDTATPCKIVVVDRLPSPAAGHWAEGDSSGDGTADGEIERRLSNIWKDVLHVSRVGIHDNLFELGGNSMSLVQLHGQIEAAFGPRLSVVDMFKYPTIASLARLLAAPAETAAVSTPAARGRQRAETRRRGQSATHRVDVAVIGLACRMPGAAGVAQFWRNLAGGVESISHFTERQVLASGVDPELVRNPQYVRAAPVLDGIEQFDADFFGYTAREAELMDPQQRVLLECAWEAMEDAGYDLRRYRGAVGVFVSGVLNTYLLNNLYPNGMHLDGDASGVMTLSSTGGFQVMIANDKDYLPTRISYKLNLRGPSVNVQTACSSSLVAIHTAAQSLVRGECDMAFAGGASICVPQETGYLYQEGLLVSPDGHCRAFDADAQGTIFGNGAGLVLLKRLDDALADGDHIYAVVKGSAVNNDGGEKAGYLAPSQDGQAAVVAEALAAAGIGAESISYVEAHGTGTALGDPIEIAGLTQAFRADTEHTQFCAVGSVKTNVGHLQIASGVAGFLKAVLCLHHGQLAPNLHFRTANPRIDWAGSPFYVNTQLAQWPEGDAPRRASVNSLGIGGTNAHVILEESSQVPRPEPTPGRSQHLLALSAKTPKALQELADRYWASLGEQPTLRWRDVCFTAAAGRAHFAHRLAVLAEHGDEARQKLRDVLDGKGGEGVWVGEVEPSVGGGTGWPQREAIETTQWQDLLVQAADRYVRGLPVDWDVIYRAVECRRVSLPTYSFQRKRYWVPRLHSPASGQGKSLLLGLRVTSPMLKEAVFESRVGLESLPILDDHRFCGTPILPGAFQLAMVVEAAARLGMPEGYAVEDVSFAEAVAIPEGGERTVQLIVSAADGAERSFQLVSRLLEDAEEPQWTVHSTGRIVAAAPGDGVLPPSLGEGPERWTARARRAVSSEEFYASMREHEVRLGPALQAVEAGWVGQGEMLCRIRAPQMLDGADDRLVHAVLLDACVQVLGGIEPYSRQRTRLPVAVRRFRFLNRPTGAALWCYVRVAPPEQSAPGRWSVDAWLFEPQGRTIAVFTGLELYEVPREMLLRALGKEDKDWIFRPAWVAQPRSGSGAPQHETGDDPWLVLADEGGVGDRLAELLRQRGGRCVVVRRGERFDVEGENLYRVNPKRAEHFLRLVEITRGMSAAGYRGVVHLWSLDQEPGVSGIGDLSLSCAGALHMIQALDRAGWTPGVTICLVTRGAQAVDERPGPVHAWQTPLWGLGRTAALEYREMKFLRVDLDPEGGRPPAESLLEELLSDGREPEVAFRGGDRFVARLEPHRAEPSATVVIRSDATYLITGGTGGLGLQVGSWLVQQGARHLVLVSRRGASSEPARQAVARWRQRGVNVVAVAADVAQETEAARLLADVRSQMPPLAGIVHAAGIRVDGTLQSLEWEQFETVLAAKAVGAWNLHRLTEDLALDFFVGFSSIASLLGSPGQGNYAAANAFLDGLMHHRRAMKRPGVAINWGPWKGAGMLASLVESQEQALARRGLQPLEPDVAIRAMAALMQDGVAQAAAARIDWQQYSEAISGPGSSPLVEAMIARDDHVPDGSGRFRLRLEKVRQEDRPGLLLEYVQELIGNLLGDDSGGPVSPDRGFYDLGLDSLSVLMLRNRLQSDLGLALPATITFKFSTIRALAGYLTESLGPVGSSDSEEGKAAEPDAQRELAAALDELSLPELAGRLAEKLTAIRRDHDEP